ncbi:hypothetical protein GCM10025858_23030 [Alicyclobacillus sacchari]|nr:hypothetical protein GCM10025858_23030 [Alicyclobacillus sacchari]
MNANVQYYVSFNNVEVGRLQGEYIAQHTKKGGTVVMLDGAPTDPNAKQFAQELTKCSTRCLSQASLSSVTSNTPKIGIRQPHRPKWNKL